MSPLAIGAIVVGCVVVYALLGAFVLGLVRSMCPQWIATGVGDSDALLATLCFLGWPLTALMLGCVKLYRWASTP